MCSYPETDRKWFAFLTAIFWSLLLPNKTRIFKHPAALDPYTAVQSKKAVTAYFLSEQLLPFGFAEQNRRDLWILEG